MTSLEAIRPTFP